MKYQDIRTTEQELFNNVKELEKDKDYSGIVNTYQSNTGALLYRGLFAQVINEITTELTTVQNLSDDDFKADLIKTSQTEPTSPTTNMVWFEVTD